MSVNRAIFHSVFWNWAGLAVNMASGFIIAPFLFRTMGEQTYGLWMVIGALTGYFGLLELGVRRSVGRQVAYQAARNDDDKVNQTISTAVAILGSLGLIGFLGVLASQLFFFRLFDVPADQVQPARIALFLVGLNLGLTLLLNVFDATLWGLQRFELINGLEISMTLARAGLTFFFIGRGGGLVELAVISVSLTLTLGLAQIVACFWIRRSLHLSWQLVRGWCVREIFSYSVWNFINVTMTLSRQNLSPILIGSLIGIAPAAAYSLVTRLTSTAANVLSVASGGLIPWATSLHAQNQEEQQRLLFVRGGRVASGLALYFVTVLILLGEALIGLWVGPQLLYALPLLIVLVVGELLPNTQYLTSSLVYAAAQHRILAFLSLLETICVVVLMIFLVGPLGLMGAGLALAIPAVFFRGLGYMWKGCSLTNTSWTLYLREVLLLPVLCAVGPALGLYLATYWRMPNSWAMLFVYGAAYSMIYGMVFVGIFEREIVKALYVRLNPVQLLAATEGKAVEPAVEV